MSVWSANRKESVSSVTRPAGGDPEAGQPGLLIGFNNFRSPRPPGYPSAWLRPRGARFRFAWQDHSSSTLPIRLNFRLARHTGGTANYFPQADLHPRPPQTERFSASRCIESAQTHRARVCSLLTRASDTTLRLVGTDLAHFPEAFLAHFRVVDQPLTMRRTRSEELGAVD
jgi:hypothetical protein